MLILTFLVLFFAGFLEFPPVSSSIQPNSDGRFATANSRPEPFTDLIGAFKKWDAQVGCTRFREKHSEFFQNGSVSIQEVGGDSGCGELKMKHVGVLVMGWTWIPDNLDNLYSCRCGLSCLWTKSSVLADKPDALLFETSTPPLQVIAQPWSDISLPLELMVYLETILMQLYH